MGFAIHWHESAIELHVFPIPIPPPTSLSTWFLWVFPVYQARALVSCIQPGLVICFTRDNTCLDAVLSKHPTLAFSYRVQKSVLYICVSFSVLHIGLSLPSADKWIRKLWYIYTMEYYSAIKKNSFELVLMRWMKLESIIQSEVSQKDKEHYSILPHIYGI